MFFLSKTIDHFFLPPGLFVLAGIVLSALGFRAGRRRAAWAGVAISAALWIVSIEPTSRVLLRPLEAPFVKAQSVPADAEAIVILGGGTVMPFGETAGRLTSRPTARAVRGYLLHRETGLPLVYSGATVFGRGRPEAERGADLLAELGVNEESILVEPDSRNTWENAANVRAAFGFENLLLVTSAFHMRRSMWSFTEQGMRVVPIATDFLADDAPFYLQSFLPDHHELYKTTIALREYIGMLYYRIRYRGPRPATIEAGGEKAPVRGLTHQRRM